jgi:hypothetical protein
MDRMTGGGAGGLDANDLSNVLRGENKNIFVIDTRKGNFF